MYIYSWYLKVEVHLKILMSQSKFTGPSKFTLRYRQCKITDLSWNVKKNRKCVWTIFFDIREYFEISVFEITRVNCTCITVVFAMRHSKISKLCHGVGHLSHVTTQNVLWGQNIFYSEETVSTCLKCRKNMLTRKVPITTAVDDIHK